MSSTRYNNNNQLGLIKQGVVGGSGDKEEKQQLLESDKRKIWPGVVVHNRHLMSWLLSSVSRRPPSLIFSLSCLKENTTLEHYFNWEKFQNKENSLEFGQKVIISKMILLINLPNHFIFVNYAPSRTMTRCCDQIIESSSSSSWMEHEIMRTASTGKTKTWHAVWVCHHNLSSETQPNTKFI